MSLDEIEENGKAIVLGFSCQLGCLIVKLLITIAQLMDRIVTVPP